MLRRSSLPRSRKRIRPVSPRRFKPRGDWHPQRVRLDAAGMEKLRWDRFKLSDGFCEGIRADNRRCMKPIDWQGWRRFELGHRTRRGKGGSDTLENVRCLCQYGPDACHQGPATSDHPGPQLRWIK